MKLVVREHVKLSPFDCSKPVHLHVDASQDGLGYLLSHPLEPEKQDNYRLQRQIVTLAGMYKVSKECAFSDGNLINSGGRLLQRTKSFGKWSLKLHLFCKLNTLLLNVL